MGKTRQKLISQYKLSKNNSWGVKYVSYLDQTYIILLFVLFYLIFLHYYKKLILPRLKKGFYLGFISEIMKSIMKNCHVSPQVKFHRGEIILVMGSIPNNNIFWIFKTALLFTSVGYNTRGKIACLHNFCFKPFFRFNLQSIKFINKF